MLFYIHKTSLGLSWDEKTDEILKPGEVLNFDTIAELMNWMDKISCNEVVLHKNHYEYGTCIEIYDDWRE